MKKKTRFAFNAYLQQLARLVALHVHAPGAAQRGALRREVARGQRAFADQPLRQRRHGCHDEEAKPQAIKHRSSPVEWRRS
mgnify:CR=1 FL=1